MAIAIITGDAVAQSDGVPKARQSLQEENVTKQRESSKSRGSDQRQTQSLDKSSRSTVTVSSEIGIGTLMLDALIAIEKTSTVAIDDKPYSKEQGCHVFDANYAVYMEGASSYNIKRYGTAVQFDDGPPYTITQPWMASTNKLAVSVFGKPEPAGSRYDCLQWYNTLVRKAVALLLPEKSPVQAVNVYGDAVILVPNIKARATAALRKVAEEEIVSPMLQGKCRVPSLSGMQGTADEVACGEWKFPARGGTISLQRAGAPWFDADHVDGRRISFADSESQEIAEQLQKSQSKYSSTDDKESKQRSRSGTVSTTKK
jgi:hypothetical protein